MTLTKDELICMVDEAQEKMGEAIQLLDDVISDIRDQYLRCYLLEHLQIYHSEGHGFMSSDPNIDSVREAVEKRFEEEEDEDEN